MSHMKQPTLTIGLLLVLATIGCRNPSQAAAPRSEPTPRASSADYQPQDSSSSASDDEGTGRRRPRRGRPREQAAPGQFDFYLLNLSWSPEFCATHSGSPECGRHLGLVVHGLWPQDTNGDFPEHCSDAPGPANPRPTRTLFPPLAWSSMSGRRTAPAPACPPVIISQTFTRHLQP